MIEILLIAIFIFIVVGLFGALIYLLFLPIKKRLLNSGKLTRSLSLKLKTTYIATLIILAIFIIYNRNYRTPSKARLENASSIDIPYVFQVIKDEYQDYWQHYNINYIIRFDDNSIQEIIASIKSSKVYDTKVNPNKELLDIKSIQVEKGI